MTILNSAQVSNLILSGEQLQKIVVISGWTYPDILQRKKEIEDDMVANHVPMTEDIIEGVIETVPDGVSKDLQAVVTSEALDGEMHTLADNIVAKLECLLAISTEAYQVQGVVTSLVTLRSAFYDKGPTIQVNKQTNISTNGEGGGVSKFAGVLKR